MYNIRHHFIPLSYLESVLSLKGPDTHNDYQLKTGLFSSEFYCLHALKA